MNDFFLDTNLFNCFIFMLNFHCISRTNTHYNLPFLLTNQISMLSLNKISMLSLITALKYCIFPKSSSVFPWTNPCTSIYNFSMALGCRKRSHIIHSKTIYVVSIPTAKIFYALKKKHTQKNKNKMFNWITSIQLLG